MRLRLRTKCLLLILPLVMVSLLLLANSLGAYWSLRGHLGDFKRDVGQAILAGQFSTALTRQVMETIDIGFAGEDEDQFADARHTAHRALSSWIRSVRQEEAEEGGRELDALLEIKRAYAALEPIIEEIIGLARHGSKELALQAVQEKLEPLADDVLLEKVHQLLEAENEELTSSLYQVVGAMGHMQLAVGDVTETLKDLDHDCRQVVLAGSFASGLIRQIAEYSSIVLTAEGTEDLNVAQHRAGRALHDWKDSVVAEDSADEREELQTLLRIENQYAQLNALGHEIISLVGQGREDDAWDELEDKMETLADDTLLPAVAARVAGEEIELQESMARLMEHGSRTAMVVSVAVLLVVGIGVVSPWLLSRKLVKPIVDLTDATQHLGAGELNRRVDIGSTDEIGRLAVTFNEMADRLGRARKELEQRVFDRTAELEAATQSTEAILKHATEGIITIDDKGIIITFNPAAEGVFGRTAEDILGENVSLLMPEPFAGEHDQYLQRYLATGESRMIGTGREVVALRRDGAIFPVELWLSEMRVGNECRFTGIVRDLTQRKRAEEEIRRMADESRAVNQDLTAITATHHDLWWCRSPNDVAGVLTETLVEKFGAYFARVWLIGPADRCEECTPTEQCAGERECLHLLSSSGHYTHIDGAHQRVPLGAFKIGLIAQGRGKTISNDVPNDDRIHDRNWAAEHGLVSFAGFPLMDGDKVLGVVAMFSQEELRPHRLDTLDILSTLGAAALRNVEQMEAMKRADTAKSEFLANMSHEIRTPMTAILGFAENLQDQNLSDSERLNCVHTICRNGEYLLDLINDILDLSKIEAGKMTFERVAVEPCRIIAEVVLLMSVRADAKGLPFNVEYIGAIPETIQSDATRLRQILINLIGNAIKFTEVGAVRLVIRFVDDGDHPYLQFDVIDTGRGMTAEQTAKLFQPFMQADTSTTRKFGGTGLGLTVSKCFAELLGGDITVAVTEPGVGSTFRVTVATGPLDGVKMLADPMSATVVARSAGSVADMDRSALQGCRVLLAEDGPDNQRLISFILKKAGAEVTVVENGKLAVDEVSAAHNEDPGAPGFDVILMDMQMPVMDGYDATRLLRRNKFTGLIIAVTAHAMEGDRDECLSAGCDDYATKPIDRKKLIETIQRHLVPAEATSPAFSLADERAATEND